jgi:hypothetical protein
MPDPLVFLAQLADGRTCLGTDRDGEARLTLLLSRHDAAKLLERLDEYEAGFYVTLVPEHAVTRPTKRKRTTADAE